MENFELHIDDSPRYNVKNGHFLKGHRAHNKGKKMTEWMDGRKIKKVKKYLLLGRIKGHPGLGGNNKKAIVGIRDGKIFPFESMSSAEKILRAKGIKVCARNISSVCRGNLIRVGKYSYIRMKAGGFRWYFSDEVEKYKDLLK